ncbi:MAG: putative zinc-binding metallopeptidase [Prevotella sp.]|nr:putative zinc-binding metallopeptidase [Prevotella sp.]
MRKIYYLLLASAFTLSFVACENDDLDSTSIFANDKSTNTTEFDRWLSKTFDPYNIRIIYRYQDYETDQTYNVIPAKLENVKALAKMMKHIWIDAYAEVVGLDFIKAYSPRLFQFIGSAEYRNDGAMVLGTAEGGLKITLFRVNSLDVDNIFIDSISPFPNIESVPIDMNFWFFHTMHHEFLHILQQTKNYSTDFNLISAGKYHANDWINVNDVDAPKEGFVTGYASGEAREDMAEIYATYVTHTPEAWEKILQAGESEADKSGREAIEKKLDIIKEYCRSSWGFELDDLRRVVLRRSQEVLKMDLRTLD